MATPFLYAKTKLATPLCPGDAVIGEIACWQNVFPRIHLHPHATDKEYIVVYTYISIHTTQESSCVQTFSEDLDTWSPEFLTIKNLNVLKQNMLKSRA